MQMHLVCLVVHLVEMYHISRLSPNHSIWGLIWKECFGACFLLSPPCFFSLYCQGKAVLFVQPILQTVCLKELYIAGSALRPSHHQRKGEGDGDGDGERRKEGLKCRESVCLSDPWRELVPQSLSNKAEMPQKILNVFQIDIVQWLASSCQHHNLDQRKSWQ